MNSHDGGRNDPPNGIRRCSLRAMWYVLAALSALATPARADVLFSTIVGNCCGGTSITGANYETTWIGVAFSPLSSAVMTEAQVEVFQVVGFGGDPYFNVSLYSDNAGLPGSQIATLGTELTAPVGGGIVSVAAPSIQLTAGAQYWLVLAPYDTATEVSWEQAGSKSVPFDYWYSPHGWSAWPGTNDFQFEIDSTPEPSALSLFSAGAALFLRRRITRYRSARAECQPRAR